MVRWGHGVPLAARWPTLVLRNPSLSSSGSHKHCLFSWVSCKSFALLLVFFPVHTVKAVKPLSSRPAALIEHIVPYACDTRSCQASDHDYQDISKG